MCLTTGGNFGEVPRKYETRTSAHTVDVDTKAAARANAIPSVHTHCDLSLPFLPPHLDPKLSERGSCGALAEWKSTVVSSKV